ncbi:MAG: DsbA family oxidoreductase [Polyangiales bacterium]
MLRVDFVHDLVCPWCRIGLANLEAAIRSRPDLGVEVAYRPFLLDPTVPAAGLPYRQTLARKLGGEARLPSIWARVEEAGLRAGVRFAFERIETMPSTLLAHALVAGVPPRAAGALVHALHEAHFLEGKDLGDRTVLASVGARATGLEADELLALLSDEGLVERVAAEAREAGRRGIHGVPFFVVGGRYALEGAQPPEVLARALDEAARASTST